MNITRITLWFGIFFGFLILITSNEIHVLGLILFPCGIFADFFQWKEDKIKGGEKNANVQNMQKENIENDHSPPKTWGKG